MLAGDAEDDVAACRFGFGGGGVGEIRVQGTIHNSCLILKVCLNKT